MEFEDYGGIRESIEILNNKTLYNLLYLQSTHKGPYIPDEIEFPCLAWIKRRYNTMGLSYVIDMEIIND